MDLAELKFVVNTKQLETAADLIKELGDEITKLNAVQKSSTAIAKDEAQAEKIRIKAQTELVELKKKLADAEDKSAKATEKNSRTAREATTETDKLQGLVSKLTNKWQDMAAGSTSAEASILNLARSLGATSNEALAPVRSLLENIRNLSKSPFDSAIGSIRSITQEMTALNQRSDLAAKGIFLSGQQLKEYSKIANEVQGQFATLDLNPFEGEGLTRATAEIEKQQKEYLSIVQTVNTLKAAEADRSTILLAQQKQVAEIENMRQKAAQDLFTNNRLRQAQDNANYKQDMQNMSAYYTELERNQAEAAKVTKSTEQPMDQATLSFQKEQARAMRESSSAAAYLEKEMKRVDFVLNEVNAELQLSTSNRLLKFEESLKRTGVTGTQAASQIEAYRKSLQKIDETRAFKRQTDDLKVYQDKVNYVTRAVGPQLTDIFSGLLTGQQSLYTIAVQQGGQLADQFSLAGIEANKMGGILASALPNMYTNIANIGKAFGQMAIGGLSQLGQKFIDIGIAATGTRKFFNEITLSMAIMADTGDKATQRIYQGMLLAAKGAAIFAGVLAVSVIGSVIALGTALYQVTKLEDEFTRTLALNGASLGLSQEAAIGYARSLNDVGISTTKALAVITTMVKEGGFVKTEIELVTKSAVDMQKYAGVAIEDTVKAFAKIKDKPVEALSEVAAATGKIAPAVITAVSALMEQGKTAEAVGLAMRTLAEANTQSVSQIRADYSTFGSWVIEWGSTISNAWDKLFKDIMFNVSPAEQLMRTIADLESKASGPGGQLFKAEYDSKIASLKEQLKLMKSSTAATEEFTASQAKGAKEALKQGKASEELGKMLLSQGKKQLSQADYVNQKIAEYTKGQGLAALSTDNLAKATKAFNQEWKDAQTKPKANPAVKLLNQDLEKLTDIKNKALGLNKDYNNSEATLVRLLNQGHINLVEYTLAMSDLNAQQPRAIKLVQEQEKAQRELNKAWEDTVKSQAKNDDEYFKQFDELNKSKVELQNQNAEIDQQYSLLGKTEEQQKLITREYVKQNKLKAAQAELEADLRKITESNASNPESLQLEAYAKNAEKIKAINASVALEFALDMQREFDSIKATITDAVVTALFDGGKAGSKKLRDSIVAQFRNKITIVVDALVNTTLNSGLSAIGLGGTSTGASAGGLAGNIGGGFIKDTILGGTSFGGAMTSGFSMATSGGMGVALEGGLSMLSSATGVQSAMAGLGQIAGALGPIALGVGAIALLAKSFDDSGTMHTGALSQYSATGGAATSQTHGAFGMGFGGVDYSEGAQKLTGEISKSIVTMLDATAVTFGKEAGYKAATAFADDSSGDGAWGGLLIQKLDETIINWDTTRSSKWAPREFSNAEAGQKEYLNAIAADTRNALESIGLPTWATKMLDAVGNAPTLESIAAVVDQINATKVALKSLGEVFPELINISDTAIDNLITVFGGLGNFAASLQSYYSNFYTESEQIERATAITSKAFADLGITMPKVDESLRTWYRGIVDSALALDQGDIANAKATASVLALQGAVNELAPAFDEAVTDIANIANILEALSTVSNAAYDQLERSVNAEKRTLQFQLDIASTRESIAQAAVDSLKSIFDTLKQSVKDLYQEVDSTSAMQVQQARGIIGSAVTSGSVNNIDDLKEAIDTVRSSLDTTSYKTKADQDRARLLLANDLAKLQASTEVQLTNEEKILAEAKSQVKMLQEQLDTLDAILSTAKEQVDEARNITGAVLSVKDAIDALAAALLAERAAIASNAAAPLAAQQVSDVKAAIAGGTVYNASATSGITTREQEIAKLYTTVLGRSADVGGLQSWAGSSLSVTEIGASIANSLEAQARAIGVDVQNSMIEQVNKSLGLTTDIKAYANGGSYKGGMALVGERGPELINFSQPGQVYTASQTSSMMNGGSSLEELVIKLNENIEGLRFEVRADVSHNSKIAKILDRVSPDGQSLSVTVLA